MLHPNVSIIAYWQLWMLTRYNPQYLQILYCRGHSVMSSCILGDVSQAWFNAVLYCSPSCITSRIIQYWFSCTQYAIIALWWAKCDIHMATHCFPTAKGRDIEFSNVMNCHSDGQISKSKALVSIVLCQHSRWECLLQVKMCHGTQTANALR